MASHAVTVNVGGGPGNSIARSRAMIDWVLGIAQVREPAFVFAQEVTQPWLDAWDSTRYHIAKTVGRSWQIRSALLFRSDLHVERVPSDWAPNLERYHGSYLSSGLWEVRGCEVVVVSVHASPSYADLEKYDWQGSLELPTRAGGGAPGGQRIVSGTLTLSWRRSLSCPSTARSLPPATSTSLSATICGRTARREALGPGSTSPE